MLKNNLVELTMGNTMKIWWAFFWRTTVFSIIVGIVIGLAAGIVLAIIGTAELAGGLGGVVGYLLSIPISILVFRYVLQKGYNNFTIVLISNDINDSVSIEKDQLS